MATVAAPPQRTWRDELTPVSRASRRRWAVAYAALLSFAAVYFGGGEPESSGATLQLATGLFVVFGMLRRGTRRVTALDHPGLDERDAMARDRAFRLAYPLLLVVLLAVVGVMLLALPDIQRTVLQAGLEVGTSGRFLSPDAMLGLVALVALWAMFLPTGTLAWIEPDGLSPDPGEPGPGLSELMRDALFASALVAGLLLGLLAESPGLGLLPLLCALGLLGRVARRGAPVQAESSTLVRVLPWVGLTLAVLFVLVILVN